MFRLTDSAVANMFHKSLHLYHSTESRRKYKYCIWYVVFSPDNEGGEKKSDVVSYVKSQSSCERPVCHRPNAKWTGLGRGCDRQCRIKHSTTSSNDTTKIQRVNPRQRSEYRSKIVVDVKRAPVSRFKQG